MSGGAHLDGNKQPVLISNEKVIWLDFGATPVGAISALKPYHGEVWLNLGYAV